MLAPSEEQRHLRLNLEFEYPHSGNAIRPRSVNLGLPASLPGFGLHPTLPAGYLPTSVTPGDFNKDGKMDWVISNGGDNSLWLYLGNGDGTNQLPIIIPCTGAAPVQVVAADLRKIGILDLVVAESDSQTIGVFLGNGDGTFAPEISYFVPRTPLSVAVGDFNGDGHQDIVVGLLGDELSGPWQRYRVMGRASLVLRLHFLQTIRLSVPMPLLKSLLLT